MERGMCLCGTEEFASAMRIQKKEVICLGIDERYKKAQRERCQYRPDYEGNETGIDSKAPESESQGREQ